MISQRRGQSGDPVHHPARLDQVESGAGVGGDGVANHLAGIAGGDDAGGAIDAHQRPELPQQPVGESVIRGHLDLASIGCGLGKGAAQPLGEFRRRLVGEGDPQRLLGVDLTGSDEVGEAARHRAGLACPGTGVHPQWLERVFDHGHLLRRRGEERVGIHE